MFSKIKPFFKNDYKTIIFVPAIISANFGAICGGYRAFQFSKEDSLIENIFITVGGSFIGTCAGWSLGVIWPIATTVYIYRLVNNKYPTLKYPTQR